MHYLCLAFLFMKKSISLLILWLTVGCQSLFAQYVVNGSDPGNTRWLQLRSPHYTLIYPEEIDSLARSYLSLMEEVRSAVMDPLLIQPRPIPVILHPYTCFSNGMVTWAPKRVELYSTPPTDGYPENWERQLAIHESRHVGQVSHYEQGIWKYLSFLLGEQATGIGLGIYVPGWFLEGDAVVAETAISPIRAGRGRNAEFSQYLRTAYLNGDYRRWKQYNLGSFRHYTPNKYVIGYYQSAFSALVADNPTEPGVFLSNMVDNWYRMGLIFPDNASIFQASQAWLTDYWRQEQEKRGPMTQPRRLPTPSQRYYTDYRYPSRIATGKYRDRILVLKSGMQHSHTLIALDTCGKEHHLKAFSPYSGPLHNDGNSLYWSEIIPDIRWEQRSWSDLYRYDFNTARTERLTHRQRLFHPVPSSEGTLAIEYPVTGSSFLVWLDRQGAVLRRMEAPMKGQIREIALLSGETVYATIVMDQGLGLYHVEAGKWICDIAPQGQTFQQMIAHQGKLHFSSDINGVLNLYTWDPLARQLTRTTEATYGASDPFPLSDGLLYADYTHEGYRPAFLKNTGQIREIQDPCDPYRDALADTLSQWYAPWTDTLSYSTERYRNPEQFPSERYHKATHLFRFHSWAPVYYHIDRITSMSFEELYEAVALGATAYSQNSLGTALTMVGYSYHDGFHSGHAQFSYSGWWPVIELSTDINDRNRINNRLQWQQDEGNLALVMNRSILKTLAVDASARIYVPLNLSRGGWLRGLVPQINYHFTNDRWWLPEATSFHYRHQLTYGLSYYQHRYPATSNIFPRWGWGINLHYGHTLTTEDLFGQAAYAKVFGYLPGLLPNQGLKLSVAGQTQIVDDEFFYFGSFADLPRGFKNRFPAGHYLLGTADYAIPVYLGDINVTPLIYLKRLQVIPFFDAAWESITDDWMSSFGADLLFDFNLVEFSIPLCAGVRYARQWHGRGPSPDSFQLLFNLSL